MTLEDVTDANLRHTILDFAELNAEWLHDGEESLCAGASDQFRAFAKERGIEALVVTADFNEGDDGDGAYPTNGNQWGHHAWNRVGDLGIDFTARQYDVSLPYPYLFSMT